MSNCLFDPGPDFGTNLNLGDDDFVEVPFDPAFTFSFYGVSQTSVFVNSNGNLTFGAGDDDFSPTPAEFINGLPRIAPIWDDFNPSSGGAVFAKALPDRFVVTWQNVPQFGETNINTFQVVLFRNGVIGFAYDQLDSNTGLVGVSSGAGGPSAIFEYNGSTNPPVTIEGPEGQLDCRRLFFLFNGTNFFLGTLVDVQQVGAAIVQDCEPIPPSEGILGGVSCTGFIDVEKVINVENIPFLFEKHTFLEKKLPFQILILDLDTQAPPTPGAQNEEKQETKVEKQEIEEVMQESEEVMQETEEVMQETEEVMQETEEVMQETEEVMQETEEVMQETEEVMQETEEVMQETEEVMQETEEVMQETEEVMQETEEVMQETEEVMQETEEVMQETEEVMQETEEVMQETEEVMQETEEVMQETEEVMQETEEVMQETEEVMQETEEVMQETEEVMQETEEVMQETEEVMQEKEEEK